MIIPDALIGILLYCIVYIAYLAALRHPRNWYSIPYGEKILVTLLLILNILFCSVSTTAIDYIALLASGIFLILVLLIIGAPSFALLRDSSIHWEFISKYADRLVPGLLLVAGLAGALLQKIRKQKNVLKSFSIKPLNRLQIAFL
jgi:hypothetical protein